MISCEGSFIRGAVVDVKGDPLPGVAVTVGESDAQAVTDARGQYKLSYSPGSHELHFMKTGYTSGHLVLDLAAPRPVSAQTVSLWCLPPGAGVYLFDEFKYRKAAGIEPKPFSSTGGGLVYGIPRLPSMPETLDREPLLVAYKTPHYDMQFARIETVKAAAEANAAPQEIWAPAMSRPTEVIPIDEPERVLLQIRYPAPLEPGLYAIHWGAFNGNIESEPQAFLFRIIDPARPVEPEPAQTPPEKPQPVKKKTSKSEKNRPEKPKIQKEVSTGPADAEASPEQPSSTR